MHERDKLMEQGFDPTFLYAWKGMRTQDGQDDRHHEYLEMCYIMTGKGRQKIGGELYDVQEGDLIAIDIPAHSIELLVDEAELAARRAAWVCPEPRIKTGYLARYARLVSSADRGAVLD